MSALGFGFRKLVTFGAAMAVVSQIAACHFADEDKMRAKYGYKPEAKILMNEELIPSFEIVHGEGNNNFEIQLKFSTEKKDVITVVSQIDSGLAVPIAIPVEQGQFNIPIRGGQKYLVTVNRMLKGTLSEITRFEDVALADFVVPEGKILFWKEEYNKKYFRFIFEEGARIRTQGFRLDVNAKELISSEGEIETFNIIEDRLPGKADLNGKSGGTIRIFADRGVGRLEISGHGQNGRPGEDGPEHKNPMAAKGYGGTNASSNITPFGLTCNRDAGSGGPGEDGLSGMAGFKGGNGGNSARVTLVVVNDSEFTASVTAFRGSEGVGGKSGSPQLGGEGGDRGKGATGCNNPGHKGKNGEKGKKGPDPVNGKPGESYIPCLKLGTKVIGCSPEDVASMMELNNK